MAKPSILSDYDITKQLMQHDEYLQSHRERFGELKRQFQKSSASALGGTTGSTGLTAPPQANESSSLSMNLGGTHPSHLHDTPQRGGYVGGPTSPSESGAPRPTVHSTGAITPKTTKARSSTVDHGSFSRERRITNHPLRVYDRVTQWQRRREQKLQEERQKRESQEIENCSFAPRTSTDVPYKWEQKSGTIYGGNGRAWGYDEFVERQREARRRQQEKQEMVGRCTGKNWKNEVTVPVEFQLGRRDRSIKALQKPLSPPTFVPSVSEHHHLAKEIATLPADSPFVKADIPGLPQQGLFSERISTAIIDHAMLHPNARSESAGGAVFTPPGQAGRSRSSDEWTRRSAEKKPSF